MKKLVVVDPGGGVVCGVCHLADTPRRRIRGMFGSKHLGRGEGLLLRPSFSVHAALAGFPVDAVFLDREMTVLSIAHGLKPWRLVRTSKARSVLQLPAGECRRLGLERGDRLGWAAI